MGSPPARAQPMAGRGRSVLQPSRPAEESASQAGAGPAAEATAGVHGRTDGGKEGRPARQPAPPTASHLRGLLSARDADAGTEAAVTSVGPCSLPRGGTLLEHRHQTGPLQFWTASAAEPTQQGERVAAVSQDDLGGFEASPCRTKRSGMWRVDGACLESGAVVFPPGAKPCGPLAAQPRGRKERFMVQGRGKERSRSDGAGPSSEGACQLRKQCHGLPLLAVP
ncbi:uncharacterized protein LOC118077313 [Zootoca vivipara]|uniref:uncharacterized protein LOC118077313 n=1 Tax=Zootoca vivipara TaxID=8524 RepID=UPI00293BF4FA|nr:uncharacterized protein LOC118077313 [Zootoca vivipara]